MNVSPLDRAAVLLRSRAGLKPEPASRARLERLLHEGAGHAGVPVQSYVNMVDTEPAAFDDLLDRVTVQHSAFFRDPAQFAALAALAVRSSSAPFTVWSAGCGNGQEPYSLAMLLDETRHGNWQVVATDVSFHALARTEQARYTENEIKGVSPERRSRYLIPARGGHEIAAHLRRHVRIAHHNLARTHASGLGPRCDAVFCRNVLMYFGREESEACIQRIAHHMAPGAHLFLGHSDSPGLMTPYFEPVRVAGIPCYRRLTPGGPPAPRRSPDQPRPAHELRPPPNLPGLLAEGDRAAAGGDLQAAIRAFRQATYLDPNLAIAYFQLGAALEMAGDRREARRSFGAAGLAMVRREGSEDMTGLGGYTRRDLARAIASKLTNSEGD
jgi:chemotaxis methyl-accepting protein methylase